jgi:3-phenylpropionate/trans-cinnamate dioxygenase ferredoxin reductase subunit
LRGEETLDGWTVKPADWYPDNDVELRLGTTALRIDTTAKTVLLNGGSSIGYSHLVLCTGGRARIPEVPGSRLSGVHILRSVADCDAIKSLARPGARAAVVGMGFIGSEVAASLRQLGVAVTALAGATWPLQNVLGETVGAVMGHIHREHGVELIADDPAARFEGEGHVERVITKAGVRVNCDFAVVGAGMQPNVEMFTSTGLAVDNGILVDAQCRTNIAGVYAAGDVANHLHPLFGRVRVEHYNNGEKMGAAVARSVLGDETPYGYIHSFWSDQFEDKLEYVGHATKWDNFVLRGNLEAHEFVGFYLDKGVLKAAVGLNRGGDPELDEDSELRACQRLIAERATPPVTALADDGVDLRDLVSAQLSS